MKMLERDKILLNLWFYCIDNVGRKITLEYRSKKWKVVELKYDSNLTNADFPAYVALSLVMRPDLSESDPIFAILWKSPRILGFSAPKT